MLEKINYLPSLGSSDHVLLDFDFNCFINVNKSAFKKFNFFKGDYNSINQALLAIPLNETLGGLSWCLSGECLTEKINNLIRSYVPVSKANHDTLKKKPPKTSQCALAIKNKHRRWMKYKYCKSDINFQQYKARRNMVASELRKAKYLYTNTIQIQITLFSKSITMLNAYKTYIQQ